MSVQRSALLRVNGERWCQAAVVRTTPPHNHALHADAQVSADVEKER